MKSTQSDMNMNFDGMEKIAPKHSSKFSGNQHGGSAEGNFGRGPTKGNTGALKAGPKTPPASAVPAFEKFKGPSDSINHGAQVRNAGGTREWSPSGTQNYKGNADMITKGRGPTKGNGQ